MAEITITPANVLASSGSSFINGRVAGESIDAGHWCYLKSSDGKIWKAFADTQEKATVIGMAANSAATDQPITIISKSIGCAVGSVVLSGSLYFLSKLSEGEGTMWEISDQSTVENSYPNQVCQAASGSTITFDHTEPFVPTLWPNEDEE
jgi:hypothetical protein